MALSEGTNYSYTPPKPKPQVNYGAPSGPYATPAASPAAVSLAHLQQTIKQPAMGPWQGMGQTELQRLGDPFAQDYAFAAYKRGLKAIPHRENPWEQRFAQGFWGTFDPRNYTPSKLYEGGKYAVQHPMDTLKTTFTTPEGLGGLTSGAAITAATGGAAAPAALSRLKGAGRAAELADNVASQANVARNVRGNFGIPNRQAMLDFADQQGYSLGAMLRGEQAPLYSSPFTTMKTAGKTPPSRVTSTAGSRGGGSAQSRSVFGHDPMEGRFFNYTGHDRAIDPEQHMQEIIDRFGYGSDEFGAAYDDYLNEPNYDTGGGMGHPDAPPFVHNVKDPHGNVMGSLSWDETPPHVGVFGKSAPKPGVIHDPEVYMRPEARQSGQSARYFRDLIQPLLDRGKHTPISVSLANDKLREPLLRRWKRGDIRLTPDTVTRAMHSDPDYPGFPNEKGMYPYEVPQDLLPPLMQALTPNFGQFPPTIGAAANRAVTSVQGLPGLRNWGQANTGGFPRNRPFYYGGL